MFPAQSILRKDLACHPASLPFCHLLFSASYFHFSSLSQSFSVSQMRLQNCPEWDTEATRSFKRLSDSGVGGFYLRERESHRERTSRRALPSPVRAQPVSFEQKHRELLIVPLLLFSPTAGLLCPSPTARSKERVLAGVRPQTQAPRRALPTTQQV